MERPATGRRFNTKGCHDGSHKCLGREGADAFVQRTNEGRRGHLRQAEVQEDAFLENPTL